MILPSVSRMIHVSNVHEESIPCRTAIVTGINQHPQTLYVTVFSRRGDMSTSVINDPAYNDGWHWPQDCTKASSKFEDTAGTNS